LYDQLDNLGIDYTKVQVPLSLQKIISENYENNIDQYEIQDVEFVGIDEKDLFKMLADEFF